MDEEELFQSVVQEQADALWRERQGKEEPVVTPEDAQQPIAARGNEEVWEDGDGKLSAACEGCGGTHGHRWLCPDGVEDAARHAAHPDRVALYRRTVKDYLGPGPSLRLVAADLLQAVADGKADKDQAEVQAEHWRRVADRAQQLAESWTGMEKHRAPPTTRPPPQTVIEWLGTPSTDYSRPSKKRKKWQDAPGQERLFDPPEEHV